MADERSLAFFFSLFFITLFGSLYCGIHDHNVRRLVDLTLKHRYGNYTGMYLKTSENVTIRVGSKLQLNCTVVGAKYAFKPQLSWYYGGKMLNSSTRTSNNNTIQLTIASVDWKDSGTYVCKEIQTKSLHPSGVFVEVGDIPSSPQDVWVNNVNFKTYIHWTRPSVTGGLPISFSVKAQCNNTSLEDTQCALNSICHTVHLGSQARTKEFTCQVIAVPRPDLTYTAFVVAENSLGSSQSCTVNFKLNLMNPLATTPLPPKTILADKKRHGIVTLTWRDERHWRPVTVEYVILYHKDGDKRNKSETVMAPKTAAVIEGLAPNSHYHFYFMTRFGRKVHNRTFYGSYSDTKELSVITDPEAPSHPPTMNCSSIKSISDNLEGRNVSISYELPQSQTFNGRLKNFQVSYTCQTGSSQETFGNLTINNTSERRAVLTGLRLTDKCRVWMKMCNYKGGCSRESNMCNIGSQDLHEPSPALNRFNKDLQLALIIAAGTLGGILLAVTIVLWRSRKQRNRRARIPLSSLQLPTVVHGYDEVEVPLVSSSSYDMLNLQPSDDVVLTGSIELTS